MLAIFPSLLATLNLILTLSVVKADLPHSIRTVSGRELPYDTVRTSLSDAQMIDAHERVFDVSGLVVTGRSLRLELHNLTAPSHLVEMRSDVVVVDGVEQPPLSASDAIHMRRGNGYHVAHKADGTVLAVWGPKLSLSPLSHAEHPGVYVNTYSAKKTYYGSHVHQHSRPTTSESFSNTDTFGHHARTKNRKHQSTTGMMTNHGPKEPKISPVMMVRRKDEREEEQLGGKHNNSVRQNRSCKHCSFFKEQNDGPTPPVRPSALPPSPVVSRDVGQGCASRTYTKELEVALATESSVCRSFGGRAATEAYVYALMSIAGAPFVMQTCLRLRISYLEINCNAATDPYRKIWWMNSNDILGAFERIWVKKRRHVHRDIAHFLIHYDTGDTWGTAWSPATCSLDSVGWSQTDFPSTITHEIGHNLNIRHNNQYGVLGNWHEGDQLSFAPKALRQLFRYIDRNEGAQCIKRVNNGPTPPPTCHSAAKADKSAALACIRSNLGSKTVGRLAFHLILVQQYDTFRLIFRPKNGGWFQKLSIHISADRNTPDSAFEDAAETDRWYVSRFRVPTSVVKLPQGASTCCGHTLYVHYKVELCNDNYDCWTSNNFFQYKVACKDCSAARNFQPMSPYRKCPKC